MLITFVVVTTLALIGCGTYSYYNSKSNSQKSATTGGSKREDIHFNATTTYNNVTPTLGEKGTTFWGWGSIVEYFQSFFFTRDRDIKILFKDLKINNSDPAIVLKTLKDLGITSSEFKEKINNDKLFKSMLIKTLDDENIENTKTVLKLFLVADTTIHKENLNLRRKQLEDRKDLLEEKKTREIEVKKEPGIGIKGLKKFKKLREVQLANKRTTENFILNKCRKSGEQIEYAEKLQKRNNILGLFHSNASEFEKLRTKNYLAVNPENEALFEITCYDVGFDEENTENLKDQLQRMRISYSDFTTSLENSEFRRKVESSFSKNDSQGLIDVLEHEFPKARGETDFRQFVPKANKMPRENPIKKPKFSSSRPSSSSSSSSSSKNQGESSSFKSTISSKDLDVLSFPSPENLGDALLISDDYLLQEFQFTLQSKISNLVRIIDEIYLKISNLIGVIEILLFVTIMSTLIILLLKYRYRNKERLLLIEGEGSKGKSL
jgi:hypothetical protein